MSVKERIKKVRTNYTLDKLSEKDLGDHPYDLMRKWLKDALDKAMEPNAMIVATVDDQGYPQERVVLLRGFSEKGLAFYTNYDSNKAKEIAQNPKVSALFFWPELERQVRVRGIIEKLSAKESDEYFASRPRESQLGAWASLQSKTLDSRETLENRLVELTERFKNKEVPRPENWGGYRIVCNRFEFWQGGANRLHDRLVLEKTDPDSWTKSRLYP